MLLVLVVAGAKYGVWRTVILLQSRQRRNVTVSRGPICKLRGSATRSGFLAQHRGPVQALADVRITRQPSPSKLRQVSRKNEGAHETDPAPDRWYFSQIRLGERNFLGSSLVSMVASNGLHLLTLGCMAAGSHQQLTYFHARERACPPHQLQGKLFVEFWGLYLNGVRRAPAPGLVAGNCFIETPSSGSVGCSTAWHWMRSDKPRREMLSFKSPEFATCAP